MTKIRVSTPQDSIYSHTIEINITAKQYRQISDWGLIPFLHSRSSPEGEVRFIPAIRLQGNKIMHLGQFLFPENERAWDKSIWVKERWNFSRENVLVDTKNEFYCVYHDNGEGGLGLYINKLKRAVFNRCGGCHYKSELIRYAKGRARKKKLLSNLVEDTQLAMKWIHKQGDKCCFTNVPLTFYAHSGIYRASLDQIVPGGGYTEENTRLVCYGFNQLKRTFSDKDVKEFIMAYGSGKPQQERLESTGKFRRKINDMIHTCNRMDVKRGFGPTNLVVEDVENLIWEAQGMCPIWKVNFIYASNSLFMPSIDRKQHELPHMLGNIFISTWAANSMRGRDVSVDEAEEFAHHIFYNVGRPT